MKLDVLAIGAHPDDVELGCGGTLAVLARQGKRVGILHLTRGEMGTRGTPEERVAEAEAAARALGAVEMDFLDCGDGGLRTGPAEEDALIARLRLWQPDLVLGPTPSDRHPDHGRAHRLVEAACFYAGLKNRAPAAGPPFRPAAVFSYMAQAAVTHAVLEVEPTVVALRPQTLVLEIKQIQRLEELGLPLATLLGDRGALDRWLAERDGGDLVGPVRRRVEEALAELRGPAVGADPGLERPFEKTREQILHALDVFGEKAVAAAARKNEVVSRRVQQLRDAAVPGGKLQERTVSSPGRQLK